MINFIVLFVGLLGMGSSVSGNFKSLGLECFFFFFSMEREGFGIIRECVKEEVRRVFLI